MFWLLTASCVAAGEAYHPEDGDVVFHTSRSTQSLAIQRATRSPYSHMGIVLFRDGRPGVFEAVEPVRWTPLDEWIARGEGGHFVAKRLRDADRLLTPDAKRRMMEVGNPFPAEGPGALGRGAAGGRGGHLAGGDVRQRPAGDGVRTVVQPSFIG